MRRADICVPATPETGVKMKSRNIKMSKVETGGMGDDPWRDTGGEGRSRRSALKVGGVPLVVMVALALWIVVAGCAGCAQNSEQPVQQSSGQTTQTPTRNAQGADTQGTYIRFDITQAPGGQTTVDYPTTQPGEEGLVVEGMHSDAVATTIGRGRMGYQQINNFSVTTGGTTASQTGSATGSGSATQTPSATPTQTPTQETNARVGVTAQAAAGQTVSQQGTGSAGEGTATGTQTSTQTAEARLQRVEATASRLEQLLPALERLLTTTQPAEQMKPE